MRKGTVLPLAALNQGRGGVGGAVERDDDDDDDDGRLGVGKVKRWGQSGIALPPHLTFMNFNY